MRGNSIPFEPEPEQNIHSLDRLWAELLKLSTPVVGNTHKPLTFGVKPTTCLLCLPKGSMYAQDQQHFKTLHSGHFNGSQTDPDPLEEHYFAIAFDPTVIVNAVLSVGPLDLTRTFWIDPRVLMRSKPALALWTCSRCEQMGTFYGTKCKASKDSFCTNDLVQLSFGSRNISDLLLNRTSLSEPFYLLDVTPTINTKTIPNGTKYLVFCPVADYYKDKGRRTFVVISGSHRVRPFTCPIGFKMIGKNNPIENPPPIKGFHKAPASKFVPQEEPKTTLNAEQAREPKQSPTRSPTIIMGDLDESQVFQKKTR